MSFPVAVKTAPVLDIKVPLNEWIDYAQGFMLSMSSAKRVDTDQVNSTTTLVGLADLSWDVEAGGKYVFSIILRVTDSNAEGLKLNLDGGTAVMDSFWATYKGFDNAFNFITHVSNLSDLAQSEAFAGAGLVEINGGFEPLSGGTIFPKFAQKTHTSGSLTVLKGSSSLVQEEL